MKQTGALFITLILFFSLIFLSPVILAQSPTVPNSLTVTKSHDKEGDHDKEKDKDKDHDKDHDKKCDDKKKDDDKDTSKDKDHDKHDKDRDDDDHDDDHEHHHNCSPTPTKSPTPSVIPTKNPADLTPTVTPTASPTATLTPTMTPTNTPTPSDTLTPTETLTPTPTPVACVEEAVWAAGVVSAAQGLKKDGTAVPLVRSNVFASLGPADSVFYTLGHNGSLALIFQNPIKNVVGTDLNIYEFTFGPLTYPQEDATVEVSQDGVTWIMLPVGIRSNINALGLNSLDFGSTGLSTIQYVRITDKTDFTKNVVDGIMGGNADGIDIDAIQGIQQTCP